MEQSTISNADSFDPLPPAAQPPTNKPKRKAEVRERLLQIAGPVIIDACLATMEEMGVYWE